MRERIILPFAALACLTAGACGPSGPPAVPPASPAVTPTGVENRIGSYVNQARSSMKLGALVRDPALDALAREHALNVAKKGKNHHEGFQSRFARAHEVTGTRVFSENVHMVAAGPDPARRLVEAWLASETHRANIGNRLWNSTGIGIYTDGTGMVWAVQVFGAAP